MNIFPIDKSLDLVFLGRNGYGRMCGLVVSPIPQYNVIYFEPLTSRGIVGRCRLEVPFTLLPRLIELLQSSQRPSQAGHAIRPGSAELMDKFGVHGEHPDCSRVQWQHEVANGDTQRGYWDFVAAKLDEES